MSMISIAKIIGTDLSLVLSTEKVFYLSDGRQVSLHVVEDMRNNGILEWKDEATQRAVESYLSRLLSPTSLSLNNKDEGLSGIQKIGLPKISTLLRQKPYLKQGLILISVIVFLILVVGTGLFIQGTLTQESYTVNIVDSSTPIPSSFNTVAIEFSYNGVLVTGQNSRIISLEELKEHQYGIDPNDLMTLNELIDSFHLKPNDKVWPIAFDYPVSEGTRRGLAFVVERAEGGVQRYDGTPYAWAIEPARINVQK